MAFVESDAASSKTVGWSCSPPFPYQDRSFQVHDTAGFADTTLSKNEISMLMTAAFGPCVQLASGIGQIIVVVSGRMTPEQQAGLTQLETIFGDASFWNYVTLVYTNFAPFLDVQAQEVEIEVMKKLMPELMDAISTDGRPRVVFVDNQTEDDSEDWEDRRATGRARLLDAVSRSIDRLGAVYMPPTLAAVRARLDEQERAEEERQQADEERRRTEAEAAAQRQRDQARAEAQRQEKARLEKAKAAAEAKRRQEEQRREKAEQERRRLQAIEDARPYVLNHQMYGTITDADNRRCRHCNSPCYKCFEAWRNHRYCQCRAHRGVD